MFALSFDTQDELIFMPSDIVLQNSDLFSPCNESKIFTCV